MLNRKEKATMDFLFSKCIGKQSVLLTPEEIANSLMPKYECNLVEIEQILNALSLDNYIDVVNSDNKGKLIYCISLRTKGEAYERDKKGQKKRIYLIVTRTVLLACLSFAVGLILKAIFKF